MTTAKSYAGDAGTAAIRGDIARTRGDMSRTVNEIEERLSPSHIKEQISSVTAGVMGDIEGKVAELKGSILGNYQEAKDQLKDDIGRELSGARSAVSDEITHARIAVREATVGKVEHMVHDARESVTEAGSSVISTIKANPIPAALIGVGLGWLIFGARRAGSSRPVGRPRQVARRLLAGAEGSAHDALEGMEGAAHDALEGMEGAAHDVGETVSHLAHDAGHRIAGAAGGARDAAVHFAGDARDRGGRALSGAGRQFVRAEHGIESTMRENPLAVGAVALALGAAIGLSLPHTHAEDTWMGAAKDRFIEQAEAAAGEAIHKAETAVGQLTSGDEDKDGKDRWTGTASTKAPASTRAPASARAFSNGMSDGVKSSNA
jgi:uncharacterized protein YjbJ (UPF0337 family)